MKVGINGVATKRVKFSLSKSTSNEEWYVKENHDARPTLDIDEMKDLGGLKKGE